MVSVWAESTFTDGVEAFSLETPASTFATVGFDPRWTAM